MEDVHLPRFLGFGGPVQTPRELQWKFLILSPRDIVWIPSACANFACVLAVASGPALYSEHSRRPQQHSSKKTICWAKSDSLLRPQP